MKQCLLRLSIVLLASLAAVHAASAEKPNILIFFVDDMGWAQPRCYGVQHAVRAGDWKLVKASATMEPMLVNLAQDPGEKADLSAHDPEKKKELQALFDKWNAEMKPPRWDDRRWNGDENRKDVKQERRKGKTAE